MNQKQKYSLLSFFWMHLHLLIGHLVLLKNSAIHFYLAANWESTFLGTCQKNTACSEPKVSGKWAMQQLNRECFTDLWTGCSLCPTLWPGNSCMALGQEDFLCVFQCLHFWKYSAHLQKTCSCGDKAQECYQGGYSDPQTLVGMPNLSSGRLGRSGGM